MNRILTYFKNIPARIDRSEWISRKDCLIILILSLLFAGMVFFRIGNTYAPQTSYTADPVNRDIILDFGEYVDISTISVFLGNVDSRRFAIHGFNTETGEWVLLNEEVTFGSVFTWNTKNDWHYQAQYLGIVPYLNENETAVLNEMVFLDPEGNQLVPVNASKYPELFDEQDLFPEVKTYLSGTMFDEIYHGRTAYEFIHGLRTYETTHPHLGKILIAIGILLFGMTPFGWRFIPALFGILMVPLVYLFAKRLFKNIYLATATTILLVFDCMHYTLSRIATIDIIAGFFILLMYYYMYQYLTADVLYRQTASSQTDSFLPKNVYFPLALSGFAMALGIATKWTGIYAGIGLGILFLWYTATHFPRKQVKKLFLFCCIFFIVVPLVIYTLSFIPVVGYTEYKGLIDKTIQGTISMFRYHSGLVAEHYYSSPFYEWPVIWMPLLCANDAIDAVKVSAVSYMGNPAIWWVGIPCVLFTIYRWLIKRDKKAGFLIIAYLAQYVPWMSVSRITFIYHYFPAILFVILIMGYTMQCICERFKWGQKATAIYLAAAIGCFFLFFPVISGLPVNKEWGLSLRWLKDWILVL